MYILDESCKDNDRFDADQKLGDLGYDFQTQRENSNDLSKIQECDTFGNMLLKKKQQVDQQLIEQTRLCGGYVSLVKNKWLVPFVVSHCHL